MILKENERLDDLNRDGLRIIQNKELYCFTQDSVLLSHFATGKNGETAVDIGTGSGIVATLLCAKHPFKRVIGVEIQPCLADMARRSVEINGLSSKLSIVEGNILHVYKDIGEVDVVVSNPPFGRVEEMEGDYNACERVARFELELRLSSLLECAAKMLRHNGRLYLVHRAERVADIFCIMRKVGIEPKRLRCVVGKAGDRPKSVLIEGRRGGRMGIIIEPELVCYNSNASRTQELEDIYNR